MIQKKMKKTTKMLMIYPEYIHYSGTKSDYTAVLPVGAMYAGELLERKGITIVYQDNQLHPIKERSNLTEFDWYGISVMGTQNIATAFKNYQLLIKYGISPTQIVLGGQGVDGLTEAEFQKIFPNATKIVTRDLMPDDYWNVNLKNQLEKITDEDMDVYLNNEVTVLFSQGCQYNCSFCGAKTAQNEKFFNIENNVRTYLSRAKRLGITEIKGYVTSLDFFQQALKGGNIEKLKKSLQEIITLQEKYNINLKLRALTRADSYLCASQDESLMSLVKEAGFYQFGFGADGAANITLLKAMHKGTKELGSELLTSFQHTENYGFTPEILYVFGIEEDTKQTLEETRLLCNQLLNSFESAIYRGFPAKNQIPGNRNWQKEKWTQSETYQKLLANPELFTNLGFETLANIISHPNIESRKLVNQAAIKMSYTAHKLGRVQSFLTVPIMENNGHELMDQESFILLKSIIENYAPEIASFLTLENLPKFREDINKTIPKDV